MKMNTQKIRRNGGSNYIAVTGFAKVDEFYKIESIDEKSFKCTRIE